MAFLTFAGGMVSNVAIIVLLYMGIQQDVFDSVRSADNVLRALARLVKNGTLEGWRFTDMEQELKYFGKESDDPLVRDLVGWQAKVGGMRVETEAVTCAKCEGRGVQLQSRRVLPCVMPRLPASGYRGWEESIELTAYE